MLIDDELFAHSLSDTVVSRGLDHSDQVSVIVSFQIAYGARLGPGGEGAPHAKRKDVVAGQL